MKIVLVLHSDSDKHALHIMADAIDYYERPKDVQHGFIFVVEMR